MKPRECAFASQSEEATHLAHFGTITIGTLMRSEQFFEKSTKSTIAEEFQKRIATPIGMEDFKPEDVTYVRGEDSIHPAYPFRMSARDMARFGLLFRAAESGRKSGSSR